MSSPPADTPSGSAPPPPTSSDSRRGGALRIGGDTVPRPGLLRRFVTAHQVLIDVVVALFAGAIGLASGFSQMDGWVFVPSSPWPWYALWALSYGGLLVRRRMPVVVTAVALAALFGQAAFQEFSPPFALLIGIYSVAVHRGARWAWTCSALVVGLIAAVSALTPVVTETPAVAALGVATATLIGINVRGRHLYLTALIDRAAQLEREKSQEVRLAAGAERARIARELHDVVAHGMSVMISLSDGATAVADLDPDRSRDAVRQIGVVGREALGDMRRLLGVLHDGERTASFAPQPGLDDLEALVETYRTAGLPVTLTRIGPMPTSPTVQVVLYRAVQEGLTNALRYADRPSRASVVLRTGPGPGSAAPAASHGVSVEITDDGKGTEPTASVGTERGLMGLRERAALFGGSVTAGPRAELGGRGWRITLTLPDVEVSPASQASAPPTTIPAAEEAP